MIVDYLQKCTRRLSSSLCHFVCNMSRSLITIVPVILHHAPLNVPLQPGVVCCALLGCSPWSSAFLESKDSNYSCNLLYLLPLVFPFSMEHSIFCIHYLNKAFSYYIVMIKLLCTSIWWNAMCLEPICGIFFYFYEQLRHSLKSGPLNNDILLYYFFLWTPSLMVLLLPAPVCNDKKT